MSEWISDSPNAVSEILGRIEEGKNDPPALVLHVEKLYKLKILETPKNIKGTEGYVVKVMNEANEMTHLLFLQRGLASKFKEVGAKEGDVLAVVNKGKNMQTGYEYAVAHWDESFEAYLPVKKEIGVRMRELGDKHLRGIGERMKELRDSRLREMKGRIEKFVDKDLKKKP